MKRIWIPLCFILGFAMLAFNLYFWGGLASSDEIGSLVRERVSNFGFVTWAYVAAGESLLDLFGLQEAAANYVTAEVGQTFATMKSAPLVGLDYLFRNIPWFAKVSYYGGPLMILVGGFAQSRKPKTFKTFG